MTPDDFAGLPLAGPAFSGGSYWGLNRCWSDAKKAGMENLAQCGAVTNHSSGLCVLHQIELLPRRGPTLVVGPDVDEQVTSRMPLWAKVVTSRLVPPGTVYVVNEQAIAEAVALTDPLLVP